MKFTLFVLFLQYFVLQSRIILIEGLEIETISEEQLQQKQNQSNIFFNGGFQRHTFVSYFQIKNTSLDEIEIFTLKSPIGENEIYLKYSPSRKTIIFHLRAQDEDGYINWEADFPNVEILEESWHQIAYRLGKKYFKLWLDCKIRKNSSGRIKSYFTFPPIPLELLGRLEIKFGSVNDITYGKRFEFHNHSYNPDVNINDQCESNEETGSNLFFNNNHEAGTYHALNHFVNISKKFDSPFVYYQLNKSATREVTEFFEDGIMRDHSFEIIYRFKWFPLASSPYYFIDLRTTNGEEIKLSFGGEKEFIKVYLNATRGKSIEIEYLADKIYNNDWHILKYILKEKIFSLWIDGEILEDSKGRKEISVVPENEQIETFLYYDAYLMVLESKTELHDSPVVDIRRMYFNGNAVTTNNTEISLEANRSKSNKFGAFAKVLGRTVVTKN